MHQFISNTINRAATLLGWLASFTLLVIMAITFIDVLGRTTPIGRPLIGTVETIELLMGILVFSGLALTEINRRHITVETFQSLFPRPFRKLSVIVNLALAVVITALLARQLIIKGLEIFEEQEHTQILEIPYWPTALIMSVGIALFLIVLMLRLFEAIVSPAPDSDIDTDQDSGKKLDPS